MKNTSEYIEKLRNSGLRPTKQRIKICEVLFNRPDTFHFSINDLMKVIKEKFNTDIALATVYNTIHAFKKKGYLKQISINSDQSYFDTNTSGHHHFYDLDKNQLIDIHGYEVGPIKINRQIPEKRVKSIEVLVKLETKK